MAIIPFGIVFLIFTLLYFQSKNKYAEEIENYSKEEYGLKDMLPIGLFILDKVGMKNIKKINGTVMDKLIMLYGIDVDRHSRAFIANKFVLSLLSSLVILVFQFLNGTFSIVITLVGLLAPIAVFYLADTMLDEQIKKKSTSMKYDFPEFLSKLALLINAGLTFEAAWERILASSKKATPLNSELKIAINDIKANIPREVALRNLARRCKVSFITKFSNIVIQNLNKGTTDLTIMLDNLASECWIERQSLAKQKGEEASSKLLFPMMLMLLSVFIITVVPAILQMFGF